MSFQGLPRGFYYGPKEDTPWNNDLLWKKTVVKENDTIMSEGKPRGKNGKPGKAT